MTDKFLKYILDENLFHKEDKILLAVSGGKDSMAMLHFFEQAGFSVGVAHCNFKLRGEDADGDKLIPYAPSTRLKKSREGRNPDIVTLFDEGDLPPLSSKGNRYSL